MCFSAIYGLHVHTEMLLLTVYRTRNNRLSVYERVQYIYCVAATRQRTFAKNRRNAGGKIIEFITVSLEITIIY